MTTTNSPKASTTDLLALITALYREALGDDGIDATSDFFESGGDSLAAFQIAAQLGETLGEELPVALIFAYPSPGDLAAVVAVQYSPLP